MSKEFTRRFRVRWSEIDATNRVPASKYLEYLSETAYDWGAANDLGFEESGALGVVWVILETNVRFLHPLHYNDQFDFTIWMVEWRRVRGTRAFELKFKDSDVIIAQGMQQVASLDRDTLRPTVVAGDRIDKFRMAEPRRFPSPRFPKLGKRLDGSFRYQHSIEWGNLDSLVHLNNAEAIRYADEAVLQFLKSIGWAPDRLFTSGLSPVPRRIHVKYQEPGLWADRLIIEIQLTDLRQDEAVNVIRIGRETDRANIMQAIYQWGLVDTRKDEACDLPEELYNVLSLKLDEARG